jgi:tRNA(Ile)-lysidine synthase
MTAPAVAAVRTAVATGLGGLPAGALVLVAVSGGTDSLALAAGLAFAAPRAGLRAGAVVVDHRLQPRSDVVAADAARVLRGLGLAPVQVVAVDVGVAGGPEAAARRARYAALRSAAAELDAASVLLGHTLDDQAETVLLALARGSGARSLSGMAAEVDGFRRPLLGLRRATTAACCAALGLVPWRDPHNSGRRYARVRVRHDALPALSEALGPGVPEALVRTADLLREDDEALERWAAEVARRCRPADGSVDGLDAVQLAAAPPAVRRRVVRSAVLAAGVPAGQLTAEHLIRVDALVGAWRGQGAVALPGGVRARRHCGRLYLDRGQGSQRAEAPDPERVKE